ncbi:AAA family ATPase [Bradyrhizobium sp. 18BD]
MRLRSLKLWNYRNLRAFEVVFDTRSPITALVGKNGSGKSNLIEAIVEIFRDLDFGEPSKFRYQLAYECNGIEVEVDCDPDRRSSRLVVNVMKSDSGRIRVPAGDLRKERSPYLPRTVFGYYSGMSLRLEEHFRRHQKRFYDALLNGREDAHRYLFYGRLVHSQFALLAFFGYEDESTISLLRDKLGIEGLESVLFIMRQPGWKSAVGDSRFWRARGVVADFLSTLYALALAPMRLSHSVDLDFRRKERREEIYLFLPDATRLSTLIGHYQSPAELFARLESTYINELLAEVRVRVRAKHVEGGLTFRELSEGEQQLLMVLGLLRFNSEEESLFLLDEPDTHLNPRWGTEYIELVSQFIGADRHSHIIMSSHDPLVLSDLRREQVLITDRDPVTRAVFAHQPMSDPRGMGVATILRSELFDLPTTLDRGTQRLLDAKTELIAKDKLTEADKRKLRRLNRLLSTRGFYDESVDDPEYADYLNAKARRGALLPHQTLLTTEQRREEIRVAQEILNEIESKE